jgi:hypothetical protein
VIVDYAGTAATGNFLPVGRDVDMTSPKPVPEVTARPTPRLKKSGPQKNTGRAEGDVEMEDLPAAGSGRKAANNLAPKNIHQQASGSKRGLQDSPTRPVPITKRQRSAATPSSEEGEDDEDNGDEEDTRVVAVDMSWLTVNEDTPVNFGEFSPAQGQVSARIVTAVAIA